MRTVHCLELGHISEHWKRYEEAYGWFTEAWRRLSPLDRSKGMKSKDVLQYLIWTEYKVRRLERLIQNFPASYVPINIKE